MSTVIRTALTRPAALGLPFACWTLDRLVAGLSEQSIGMRCSRISEILLDEGLKWRRDLNLIEPWWKVLRSLALKGRRFDAWAEIEQAVERATADWNDHKHPFVWGHCRRHRPPRRFGVAGVPKSLLI